MKTSAITQTNSIVLDLIRFLCSQGVVVGHALAFLGLSNRYTGGLASYCVLLFFILSGFLISLSLFSKRESNLNYDFKSFFMDRFFRIFPPFIASLFLVLILDFISYKIAGSDFTLIMYVKNFVINLFQLQGFPIANILYKDYGIEFFYFRHLGSNVPLWTISIEWWMYMFFGYFTFHFILNKARHLYQYLILLFLLITPVYYLFVSTKMDAGLSVYWLLGTIITFGMYRFKNRYKNKQKSIAIFSFTLIAIGIIGYSFIGYTLAASTFFIGLFVLFVFSNPDFHGFNRLLRKTATSLASYSYSLYLIHYPIIIFILSVFKPGKSISSFILLLLVSNIAAYFFARIFETKTKYLKTKYENYRRHKNQLQTEV